MPKGNIGEEFPEPLYERMGKTMNSIFHSDGEKISVNAQKEREMALNKNKGKFQKAKKRFERKQELYSSKTPQYQREEVRFMKKRDVYVSNKKKIKDHVLRRALPITHINMDIDEVRAFSNTTFVILLILLLIGSVPVLYFTQFDILFIMLCGITLVLVPGLTALYIEKYPVLKAKRMRALTVGKMPQVIHHLSLSMRLNPSLDTAVRYASKSAEEPMASELQKVLWDVYMREHASVEDAFLSFAHDWGDWDDNFKRSLYMVRSAELENDEEALNRVLDKANDIIIEGTTSKLEAFAAALNIPSLVLFAIGIMLPLLIAILLPILGIGDEYTGHLVVGTNVILPLFIGTYTYYILGNRPELSSIPKIQRTTTKKGQIGLAFFCILVGATLIAGGIYFIHHSVFATLLIIWGLGAPVILYCKIITLKSLAKARVIRKMEDEYPEALFQLGNRIGEGKPFETALDSTAAAMKNTLIATFFAKMSYNIRTSRSSLKEILLGPNGLLAKSPAKTIKNTMNTVVEAVKKDSRTAGKTLILISNYLSELKNVENKMKNKLLEVTGMMTQTALFIAPVVMGFTVVLYQLMNVYLQSYDIPQDMDIDLGSMGQQSISPIAIALALGIYLMEIVIIIALFVGRINFGKDKEELKNSVATYLFIALLVYSFTMFIVFLLGKAYIPGINAT